MNSELTEKQREVLEFIEVCVQQESRSPSYREIARAFGFRAVATVEGHVLALRRKGFLELATESRSLRPRARAQVQSIPIVGRVPAGIPIEAIESHEGYLSFSASSMSSKVSSRQSIGRDVFALKVVGESMSQAGILDGDFVIVQKNANIKSGDVVVASVHGDATVKEYRRVQNGVWLVPKNPKFEPKFFEEGEGLDVVGKVVGLQRFYV